MRAPTRNVLLLLAVALLGAARAGPTGPPPEGYSTAPGWNETVAAYREAAAVRQETMRQAAGHDQFNVALGCATSVLTTFLLMMGVCYAIVDKEQSALHDYVLEHHQDADTVDAESGATEILAAKNAAKERRGISPFIDDDDDENYGKVEGRFGLANYVQVRRALSLPPLPLLTCPC